MSGTTRSSGNLPVRRKKALYRSWHRGIREMDLLFGTFADAAIDSLSPAELDRYEVLLDQSDTLLIKWFTGEAPVPVEYDHPLFRRIQAFRPATPA